LPRVQHLKSGLPHGRSSRSICWKNCPLPWALKSYIFQILLLYKTFPHF
jgi:hypothetical protein